jgi:hypothetical protein
MGEMSCCGARRAAFVQAHAIRPAPAPAPRPGAGAPPAGVELDYRGPVPMVLLGPVSGRVYRFSRAPDRVDIDPSDGPALLRSDWFRRVD